MIDSDDEVMQPGWPSEVSNAMTTERTGLEAQANGAAAVAQTLVEAGVTHAFGIPGGDTGLLFRALARRTDIRTVVVRHESLGSVMAESHGRLSDSVGVLIGQAPWVTGLGMIGILEALLSSSPMLILTDLSESRGFSMHGAYQDGSGNYGSWDVRASLGGITKRIIEVRRPAEAIIGTQLAIKHALTGEPGPIGVLYTRTALEGSISSTQLPHSYPTEQIVRVPAPIPADEQLQAAADALAEARHPIILIGNGVRIARAGEEVLAFAERFQIPIVTSAGGKGTVSEQHELVRGVYGTFGVTSANEAVAHSDVVLVLGSKLGASDTAFENPALLDPRRQTFIHVDIEPLNLSWTFPAHHPLVGDIGPVLMRLAGACARPNGSAPPCDRCLAGEPEDLPPATGKTEGLSVAHVIRAFERVVASSARVVCDAGENRIFMTHFFRTARPGGFMQAAGAGPMGYAIPAAMGVKLLYPAENVIAVVGDGGFAMTMSGLMTAIEEHIPIGVLILNNRNFGWSYHGGSMTSGFADFDLASVAAALGCESYRVTDPASLDMVLSRAFAGPKRQPVVVEALVNMDTSFLDVTSSLAK
jgi:acetolactate synthase I/II/III large subunit